MLLIWKEYFICGILLFSSPRCAMIAHLNVIYTKFRHGMIAQLNKIWHVWVCAHVIAHHSRPGLEGEIYVCQEIYWKKLTLHSCVIDVANNEAPSFRKIPKRSLMPGAFFSSKFLKYFEYLVQFNFQK